MTTLGPVDRLLAEIGAGRGIRTDPWADDAPLDAYLDAPLDATLDATAPHRRAEGDGAQLDLGWVEGGVPQAAHQVDLIPVDGDRISRDTGCCGGRRSAALLAEMEAARGH